MWDILLGMITGDVLSATARRSEKAARVVAVIVLLMGFAAVVATGVLTYIGLVADNSDDRTLAFVLAGMFLFLAVASWFIARRTVLDSRRDR